MFNWEFSAVLEVVVRTAVVYVVLLTGIRLAGKREIGQLTPFDLVVLLLISNSVQNAMVGKNDTLNGGVVAATTLLLVNSGVVLLRQKSAWVQRLVEGIAIPLILHGQIQYRNLLREHMTQEELMAALREHEVSSLDQVELAMIEVDGSISVIRHEEGRPDHVVHTRKRWRRRHHRHG